MKKLLVIVLVLLFLGSASAQVRYDITTNEDRTLMNTTIKLSCNSDCPVNSWRLSWSIQEGAEILGIEDSQGEIEEYTLQNGEVQLKTNSGPARESEKVTIRTRSDLDAEEIHKGLYKRTLQLPGFQGKETSGIIKAENLISGRTNYGFNASYSDEELRFRGDGPTNIRLKFGEGYETTYYEFFGDEPSGTENAYEISVGTLGIYQRFKRFPVAILPDEKYDREVNEWSTGEYVSGSMRMRAGTEEDFLPVLGHETVHGINDRRLNWDQTSSSYFDEGTAEYVEFLVRRTERKEEADKPTRELFGEEVKWDPDPDDNSYKKLPSQGDKEKLWNYYQQNSEFMKTWNPHDYPDNRKFGYAYSHLLIRNHVMRNRSLNKIYKEMAFSTSIDSPQRKWNFYSQHLDMTPCKYESKQRFNQCLDKINEYDYRVFKGTPSSMGEPLQIDEIKAPKINETSPVGSGTGLKLVEFISGFFEYIASLLP